VLFITKNKTHAAQKYNLINFFELYKFLVLIRYHGKKHTCFRWFHLIINPFSKHWMREILFSFN